MPTVPEHLAGTRYNHQNTHYLTSHVVWTLLTYITTFHESTMKNISTLVQINTNNVLFSVVR